MIVIPKHLEVYGKAIEMDHFWMLIPTFTITDRKLYVPVVALSNAMQNYWYN